MPGDVLSIEGLDEAATRRSPHRPSHDAATRTLSHRVFYFTLYSLGLRLSEGLALKVGDVDGKRGRVHVRDSKGNFGFLHPNSKRLIALLHIVLKHLPTPPEPKQRPPLVCTCCGAVMQIVRRRMAPVHLARAPDGNLQGLCTL